MSDGRRHFIFISIPRCASSSVQSLLGLSGWKDLSKPTDCGLLDNHAPCEMVLRRYGQGEFNRRFKFCFVRNPWDRCVSWYHYHRTSPPYNRYTFRDWIAAGMPHHWEIQNGTVYQDRRTPLEQFPFITQGDGEVMVDFVGKTEHFETDLAYIAEQLDVSLPSHLPRLNAATGRHSDYRRYYDDSSAEQIGNRLQRDVRMFDYAF
jgi:chondroitin 4-sulfotransferase 11